MSDPTRPDIPADDAITRDELEAALRRLAEITGNRDAYYPELARRIVEHVQERRTSPVATKDCGCGPVEPCEPHRDAGDLQDWEGRARAAEVKLARIREEASEWAELAPPDDWGESVVDTFKADVGRALLRIIDGGKADQPATFTATCTGPDCGEQFTDSETGEYEFATRERMERLLYADGWRADPVLCPACQEEAP